MRQRTREAIMQASFFVAGLLIGAALFGGRARAHDAWWNGREVDPITKKACCGDNDAKHLDRNEITIVKDGYRLADTGEVVPFAKAQPSPDGEFWVFRWGSPVETQCFFAPVNGA